MMVGPCPAPTWPKARWYHIASHMSCVYFNHALRGMHLLASRQMAVTHGPAELPMPSSYPKTKLITIGDYFYTSASLENVTEITPCLGEPDINGSIVGLLLRYSNGRQACVGRFRLDRAGKSLKASASGMLFLGFSRTMQNHPYVARVSVSRPRRAELTWLDLPWEGKLEWWFSCKECKVCHEGKMSLPLI